MEILEHTFKQLKDQRRNHRETKKSLEANGNLNNYHDTKNSGNDFGVSNQ